MRRLPILWGAALLAAACTPHPDTLVQAPATGVESSGSPATGGVTSVALHGQVVVAHPPGRRDAIEEVQRVAKTRCPGGYLLRSMRTRPPVAGELATDHLVIYDAVIDCGGPLPGSGKAG
jgi:hypothetical protein